LFPAPFGNSFDFEFNSNRADSMADAAITTISANASDPLSLSSKYLTPSALPESLIIISVTLQFVFISQFPVLIASGIEVF